MARERRNKPGPASKFNPDVHIPLCLTMRREGASIEEMASRLHIGRATLYRWMGVSEALRDAVGGVDTETAPQMVKSLIRRGLGFEYKETKVISHIDDHGLNVIDRIEQTNKVALPDVTAAMAFLTNMDPERWKNRQDAAHALGEREPIILEIESDQPPERPESPPALVSDGGATDTD